MKTDTSKNIIDIIAKLWDFIINNKATRILFILKYNK